MSSSLGVHVMRGQQMLAELTCMAEGERATPSVPWTRRSAVGISPILDIPDAQLKASSPCQALHHVSAAPSQGEINREKLPGKETSFGLLEKRCYLCSDTPTNITRMISCISYSEWLCHYDLVNYFIAMLEPRLQWGAGASPSSDAAKLRDQTTRRRRTPAHQQIGGAFTRTNRYKEPTYPITFHFLFATGTNNYNCTAPSHKDNLLGQVTALLYYQSTVSSAQQPCFPVNPAIPFSTIRLCILKAPSSPERKSNACYSQVPYNP